MLYVSKHEAINQVSMGVFTVVTVTCQFTLLWQISNFFWLKYNGKDCSAVIGDMSPFSLNVAKVTAINSDLLKKKIDCQMELEAGHLWREMKEKEILQLVIRFEAFMLW